jgi:N-acetylmuramoyl-L-alanine amidase
MMKPMKDVLYIVVHCTSTKVSQTVTVDDIDRWHKARNFAMIGYHWVIYQDGSIHKGRDELYAGEHVKHYNQHAIGVCYVGGKDDKGRYADTRTPEQKAALWHLLKELKQTYPQAKVVGHRDFPNVSKLCPCYDCQSEYAAL